MTNRTLNNVKLGAFTMAGLLFLVLLLYMIGKNQNMFGDNYLLRARFTNVQGLISGNNVRYAGIETGTVKDILIINDTTIEVTMVVDSKMKSIIRRNASVSVGTEGFVGNKVVNIIPGRGEAPLAVEGDVLLAKKSMSTDEMLERLSQTNQDIGEIAAGLKIAIQRINSSSQLWSLLNDPGIPADIRQAAAAIRLASARAAQFTGDLQSIAAGIREGKGTAGMLLRDSAIALHLDEAILRIRSAGAQTDSLVAALRVTAAGIQRDIDSGSGVAQALVRDTAWVYKVGTILENIRAGTDGFNQNMEALKHNFLFRGYFKKLERARVHAEKESQKKAVNP
jgi:phospholipid/cholesterol/gamma-HCH transport system substrate-binding protein